MKEDLLDALIEVAGQHARMVLLDLKMRSLAPSWVLVSADGQLDIVATPWGDDQEKERYARGLRAVMREKRTLAYSFLTEAWTAILEKDEYDKDTGRPHDGIERASQRQNRQECVIACACSAEESRWKQWRIVREATTERIIALEERPFPGSGTPPESWLTGMLRK
jgi:hypothetical protein